MDDRFDSPRFRHWIRSLEINWLNLSHPFLWKETHYYHYLESNLHFKILFSVLIPSHHLLFHEKNGKKPCRATATGHSVNISKSILFTFLRFISIVWLHYKGSWNIITKRNYSFLGEILLADTNQVNSHARHKAVCAFRKRSIKWIFRGPSDGHKSNKLTAYSSEALWLMIVFSKCKWFVIVRPLIISTSLTVCFKFNKQIWFSSIIDSNIIFLVWNSSYGHARVNYFMIWLIELISF